MCHHLLNIYEFGLNSDPMMIVFRKTYHLLWVRLKNILKCVFIYEYVTAIEKI